LQNHYNESREVEKKHLAVAGGSTDDR